MLKQRDEAIARKEQFVVLDIPLLYESGLDYLVGKVLVVTVLSRHSAKTADGAEFPDRRRSDEPDNVANAFS